MPIVPKTLQGPTNAILKKIQRSAPYYKRYNNTLGFRLNEGYFRYARECAAEYAAKHGTQDFAPSPLATDGVKLCKGALSADKARTYSERISELIARNDESIEPLEESTSKLMVRIKDPLKTLGMDLLDSFRNPEMHSTLLAFFRGNYRIQWVTLYRTLPSESLASSWLWHSDSYPPFTLKCFLHLTPATAETGATEFMSLEDTMAYRRAGYFGQYKDDRTAEIEEYAKEHNLPYRPIHLDAQPGDATIFNMNFMHRAVAPRQDFRDVVQFFLMPNLTPWDEQIEKGGIDNLIYEGTGYPKDPRQT